MPYGHTRDRRLVCIEYSRRSLAHLARTLRALRAFLCNFNAAFGLLAQYFLGGSVCRDVINSRRTELKCDA